MKLIISRTKLFRITRCGLALALLTGSVWAQEQPATHPVRYNITDLGTLGGTTTMAFFVNTQGAASGAASLSGGNQHAFLWQNGRLTDLGTFGGPNSIAFGGPNFLGQVVGEAETSTSDPNGEDYCGFGTYLICQPFLWQHSVMTPLPTLGGHNGTATNINKRGEVVGSAENNRTDPACPAPQVLQFKPVVWENGKIHELQTFPGDPDGSAFWVNDYGVVVGTSGTCGPFDPNTFTNLMASHALLWKNGQAIDLHNLGGSEGNIAFSINNQNHVVGLSDLPGDTTFHAFLWTEHTGMKDLGTLPGDVASVALNINDAGDVVGVSLDTNFNLRPFLRQNGEMIDFSTLTPADSPLIPLIAEVINIRGQVVGTAFDTISGELHGFLATPIGSQSAATATQNGSGESAKIALPENVRKQLQQRLRFGRFGVRLMAPR
jgi:probable HAF family extracellular repeat protein